MYNECPRKFCIDDTREMSSLRLIWQEADRSQERTDTILNTLQNDCPEITMGRDHGKEIRATFIDIVR
jgi:hypothetical protein